MSYYCNRGNLCPGAIEGSALDGLCSRVAIAVRRVLDSSKRQITQENTRLAIKRLPPDAKPPFVFQCAASAKVDAVVSDLHITRIDERPCFARVKFIVTVPILVTFTDANNEKLCARSEIQIPEDIVMYVPEASVFPFEITAVASCNCPTGKFDTDGICSVTACLTIIAKVVADTDLLVPAYGYCTAPEAVDFEDQACDKFFDLPLYPSGN